MLKVLIAEPTATAREGFKRRLAREGDITVVGVTENGADAIELVRQHTPDVVILAARMPELDGLATARKVAAIAPTARIVMTAGRADAGMQHEATRAGATDFLTKPISGPQLVGVIRGDPGGGDETPPSVGSSDVVAVISPSGGAGVSLIAANLGLVLAMEAQKGTVLVDLDLKSGSTHEHLGMAQSTDGGIAALAAADQMRDPEAITQMLKRPTYSTLAVLPTTQRMDLRSGATGAQLDDLVGTLRSDFDHVVVDCGKGVFESTLRVIAHADRVLLVSDLAIPSIHRARNMLRFLTSNGVPIARIQLVVNHRRQPSPADSLSPEEISRLLNFIPIAAEIPYSPEVIPASLGTAQPLVISAPTSHAARCMFALAGAPAVGAGLSPSAQPAETRRRKRLFRKGT